MKKTMKEKEVFLINKFNLRLKKYKFILMSPFILFFVACTPKTTVLLLDSGKEGSSILVTNGKGTTTLDKVGNYVNLDDKNKAMSKVKIMSKKEINSKFARALASTPLKPLTYVLYFQKNSKELTDVSKDELEIALKSIEERSPCIVDIIGHTDTTGSSLLNLKVSLKRAKYIESIIKEKKIKVFALISKGYGEEDLLVQTDDNVDEAKNRNVEIFIK